LVPLIAYSVITTISSLQARLHGLQQSALEQTRDLSALVEAQLSRQLVLVSSLALLPALDDLSNLAPFAEALRRTQAVQSAWLSAFVADPDGRILIRTSSSLRSKVVDLEGFRQVVDRAVPSIGSIATGARQRSIPIRAPVVRNGAVKAVVVAAIRPDIIGEELRRAGLPAQWTGTVIDNDGRIVARTHDDATAVGLAASAAALSARTQATEGIYEGRLLEGVPTVSAFHVSPRTGYSVHIGIPRAIFRAPLDQATWIAVLGGGASLALAGVFLFLLAREISLRRGEALALERAQRMEALGRLTGGVAHDFNNLLTVITGNLELLGRRIPAAGASRSFEAIRKAADRGANITRGLLSFSRAGFSRHIVVDINQQLREALGVVQQTLDPSSTVELDLDDGLPQVSLDPVQFDLALLNLAANARDAMLTPGTVRISSRAVAALDGTPSVAIAVSDPGNGIPPGVLKRVFEPFFTTKGIGEGSGLGLTQVYGFAQNAGGVAQIDSRPGVGTTVTIILPGASEPGEAEPSIIETDSTASSSPAGRVLLVDDNEAVRSVAAAYLRDCGFAVAEAADAASAIGLLEQSSFEAIVSDVVMPGAIDGIGLAREVGRRWPLTPLILISGYAKSLADAGNVGARLLAKPFAPAALVDVIRQEMDVAGRASRALG
jgi:signal transduction histidine kinase/CheY-like chemotaxis protein